MFVIIEKTLLGTKLEKCGTAAAADAAATVATNNNPRTENNLDLANIALISNISYIT